MKKESTDTQIVIDAKKYQALLPLLNEIRDGARIKSKGHMLESLAYRIDKVLAEVETK